MPAQKHLPLLKSTLKTNKTLKTPVSLVLRVSVVHGKRRRCLGRAKVKPQPQQPCWPDGGLRKEDMLHPAKAVAPMHACGGLALARVPCGWLFAFGGLRPASLRFLPAAKVPGHSQCRQREVMLLACIERCISECRRTETGCLESSGFTVHFIPALQSAAREASD